MGCGGGGLCGGRRRGLGCTPVPRSISPRLSRGGLAARGDVRVAKSGSGSDDRPREGRPPQCDARARPARCATSDRDARVLPEGRAGRSSAGTPGDSLRAADSRGGSFRRPADEPPPPSDADCPARARRSAGAASRGAGEGATSLRVLPPCFRRDRHVPVSDAKCLKSWCRRADSNRGPADYEGSPTAFTYVSLHERAFHSAHTVSHSASGDGATAPPRHLKWTRNGSVKGRAEPTLAPEFR